MTQPADRQTPPAPSLMANVLFWTLLTGLVGLTIAPIWLVDLLPVVDCGSHLHLITLLHEIDRNPVFQRHYIPVDAIVPYLGYYELVHWLAYLRDVEWANRVVLSACLIALPLSALSLLRAAGHSRWLVLGVVPWMLNDDFFMGFFSFLMSIPLFLWLLAAHLRWLQRPTWRRGLGVAGLLGVLAVTHYLLWAIGLAILPLMALLFGWRNGWQRGLWWPIRDGLLGVPSVAVLLPWFLKYFVYAEGVMTSDQAAAAGKGSLAERLANVYAGVHLAPVENVRQIVDHLFVTVGLQGSRRLLDRPAEITTVLWLAGMVLWTVGAVRQVRPQPAVQGQVRVPGGSYVAWSLAFLSLLYFLTPVHLVRPIWLFGVNFRLIEVLAVLAVVALPLEPAWPPPTARWRTHLGTASLLAAAIVLPLGTLHAFRVANREYGAIRQAYAAIPPGKAVLTLRSKRSTSWLRYHIFNNVGEYYGVFRKGYVPYSFADTSSKPLVVDKRTAIPAPPWDQHELFRWDAHGRYYDYIAMFDDPGSPPPPWRSELPDSLEPVFQRGAWKVLRNPSPDPWPPPTDEELASLADRRTRDWAIRQATASALADVGLPGGDLAPWEQDLAALAQALPWPFVRVQVLAPLGWPSAAMVVLPPPPEVVPRALRPPSRLPVDRMLPQRWPLQPR